MIGMIKQKKSQYYIFAVIILVSVVYLLIPKQTELGNPDKSTRNFFQNYKKEMPYFANNAFLNNDEMIARNFTLRFIDFAAENGVPFNITYIFASQSTARVFTTENLVVVHAGSEHNISFNVSKDVGKISFINLTIDGKTYLFHVIYPSFKAIAISRADNRKEVFVYE
jgi:hypothetical protein